MRYRSLRGIALCCVLVLMPGMLVACDSQEGGMRLETGTKVESSDENGFASGGGQLNAGGGNGEYGDSVIIIGGENGVIGQYPDENDPEDDASVDNPQDEAPEEERIEFPDGTSYPESEVRVLADGAKVAPMQLWNDIVTDEKVWYVDGTLLEVSYRDTTGHICGLEDAYGFWADWYDANGVLFKEAYYEGAYAKGETPIMKQGEEYIFSSIEQSDGVAVWHSSTIIYWYDEETGKHPYSIEEYNPVYGESAPDKVTSYDGDGNMTFYALYKYDLDGNPERTEFYRGDGTLEQLNAYDENGEISMLFLYYEDGKSIEWEEYYENGVITLSRHFYESGAVSVNDYKNGVITRNVFTWADGHTDTTSYDAEGNPTVCVFNSKNGAYRGKVVYGVTEDGKRSLSSYYDENDVLTKTEECYEDGWIHYVRYYDKNGNITKIEEYDEDMNLIE